MAHCPLGGIWPAQTRLIRHGSTQAFALDQVLIDHHLLERPWRLNLRVPPCESVSFLGPRFTKDKPNLTPHLITQLFVRKCGLKFICNLCRWSNQYILHVWPILRTTSRKSLWNGLWKAYSSAERYPAKPCVFLTSNPYRWCRKRRQVRLPPIELMIWKLILYQHEQHSKSNTECIRYR